MLGESARAEEHLTDAVLIHHASPRSSSNTLHISAILESAATTALYHCGIAACDAVFRKGRYLTLPLHELDVPLDTDPRHE